MKITTYHICRLREGGGGISKNKIAVPLTALVVKVNTIKNVKLYVNAFNMHVKSNKVFQNRSRYMYVNKKW